LEGNRAVAYQSDFERFGCYEAVVFEHLAEEREGGKYAFDFGSFGGLVLGGCIGRSGAKYFCTPGWKMVSSKQAESPMENLSPPSLASRMLALGVVRLFS
jgi:hypothetical protein